MNDTTQSMDQQAGDAAEAGKAYAKDAVNAAGKKIHSAKSDFADLTETLNKAIHDDPVRAVAVTALVSAALTALALTLIRREDRFF